jgi:hypothetical protein
LCTSRENCSRSSSLAAEKLVIDLIALRNERLSNASPSVGQIDKTAAFIGRIVLAAQGRALHSAEHLRQRRFRADRRFNQRHLFDPGCSATERITAY